ncbi:hypothetical protein AaE_013639 [Aphanomyces astaci]|uniref:DNA 3'-5' helicase n=1 Tax=Aphanomyces astaci TaxID=112090 RepID=A0A6A4Z6E2_APHAT|nr:hypothetical protein AaE_013639 [Aphanomyces astaci]
MLDRPNLRLQVLPKTKSVLANMASLLKAREPAIVYVLSQKDAEAVAAGLMAFGIQAQPYHAGLSDPARKRAQQLWTSGKISVICATVAFGFPLPFTDMNMVEYVCRWESTAPTSATSSTIRCPCPFRRTCNKLYVQCARSSRCNFRHGNVHCRDGLPATCTLFYAGGDRGRAAFVMSGGDGFLDASASHGMRDVVEMVTSMDCRRRILHSHFGNDMATLSDEEGCCRNCNCGESVVDEDEEATRSERRAAMTAKRPSKNLDVEWLYQRLLQDGRRRRVGGGGKANVLSRKTIERILASPPPSSVEELAAMRGVGPDRAEASFSMLVDHMQAKGRRE